MTYTITRVALILLIIISATILCVKIYIKIEERNDKCYKTIKPKFHGLQGFDIEYSRVDRGFARDFVKQNKLIGIELIEISIDEFERARKKAQRKSP